MPELLFLHIAGRIHPFEKSQSINFSRSHRVVYENNEITIEKKESPKIYSDSIHNFSLLVGKNGSGKSTILDIVSKNHVTTGSYFAIYHISGDQYYAEGSGSFIEKNVNNLTKGYFDLVNGKVIKSYQLPDKLKSDNDLQIYYSNTPPNIPFFIPKRRNSRAKGNNFIRISPLISLPLIDFIEFISEEGIDSLGKEKESTYRDKLISIEISSNYRRPRGSKSIIEMVYSLPFLDLKNIDFNTPPEVPSEIRFAQKYFSIKVVEDFVIKEIISATRAIRENNNKTKLNQALEIIFRNIQENMDNDEYITPRELMDTEERIKKHLFKAYSAACKYTHTEPVDLHYLTRVIEELEKRISNSRKISIILKDGRPKEALVKLLNFSQYFNFRFTGLSDGEAVYFNLFSTIFSRIRNSTTDILFLLDEPDINLHPEWVRNIINDLNNISKKYSPNRKIQFIITTHSPFMVSDVPNENVWMLDSKDNSTRIYSAPRSFAANILDIMSDSFFLEYPIGEFSRNYLSNFDDSSTLDIIDDPLIKEIIKRNV